MGLTVSIDPNLCTGHGRCVALAPEVFDFDEQGDGTVLVPEVAADQEDSVENAVRTCPEGAIGIRRTESVSQ